MPSATSARPGCPRQSPTQQPQDTRQPPPPVPFPAKHPTLLAMAFVIAGLSWCRPCRSRTPTHSASLFPEVRIRRHSSNGESFPRGRSFGLAREWAVDQWLGDVESHWQRRGSKQWAVLRTDWLHGDVGGARFSAPRSQRLSVLSVSVPRCNPLFVMEMKFQLLGCAVGQFVK